jgi:hypothetical protein
MNAGVRISPREVRIVPVRALPSVPVRENENGVMTAVMPCETENAKPANEKRSPCRCPYALQNFLIVSTDKRKAHSGRIF